jgi:hypothetical protein
VLKRMGDVPSRVHHKGHVKAVTGHLVRYEVNGLAVGGDNGERYPKLRVTRTLAVFVCAEDPQ